MEDSLEDGESHQDIESVFFKKTKQGAYSGALRDDLIFYLVSRRARRRRPRKLLYSRDHQRFWNWELLLVHRLMRRATSLIQTNEINILLNLPSVILVLIFVNVKTLIMLMLFSERARGRLTWSLRATWCPRTPCWWPLQFSNKTTS